VTIKAWVIALSIARAVDITTTCVNLHKGATEANPIVGNCQQGIAVMGAATAMQAFTLPVLANEGHPTAARWIARVCTYAEVAITSHNVRVMVVMNGKK
jgi:hypothetical protein